MLILLDNFSQEKNFLGSAMLNNKLFNRKIFDQICEHQFSNEKLNIIFNSIYKSVTSDEPYDILTIKEDLERDDLLKRIGGEIYLFELGKYADPSCYEEYPNNDRSHLKNLVKSGIDSEEKRKIISHSISEFMGEGDSIEELANVFGVNLDAINEWINKYPEIKSAIKDGLVFYKSWWLEQGRLNINNPNFNTNLWYINMQNRFGWHNYYEKKITNIKENDMRWLDGSI